MVDVADRAVEFGVADQRDILVGGNQGNDKLAIDFLRAELARHGRIGADSVAEQRVACLEDGVGRENRLFHAALDPDVEGDPFARDAERSEEHTSELQSLMRTSYAVFFLKTKK